MDEHSKYPIHGSDPEGGTFRHPGEIEVTYVEEDRIEIKDAKQLPLETVFKKVEGRYRAVMKIKVFGSKGNRRLEYYDSEDNLITTVRS